MKFLADENIPSSVVEFLREKKIDVVTLEDLGKERLKDVEITDLAQIENRVLLTLDLDFGYIYYFERRGLVDIVIIRVKPATSENIIQLLTKFLESKVEPKGLVIVTEKRVRVLR